jgi:hypothetical protein
MPILFPVLFFLFLLLAGVGLIGPAGFSLAERTADSTARQSRVLSDLRGSSISIAHVQAASGSINAVVGNTGRVSLGDFGSWDLLVRYTDDDGDLHVKRLIYTNAATVSADEWTVAGIFLDPVTFQPKVHQPGILLPGEVLAINANPVPAPAAEGIDEVSITSANGVTSTFGRQQ